MALPILLTLALSLFEILASPIPQTLPTIGSSRLNPYPNKPRIVFRKDGTLKITVFSDLHFGEFPDEPLVGPAHDLNSTRLMKRVLKEEKPDYAVVNGDLVTGEYTFKNNVTRLLDQVVAPLNVAKVPFSSSHGNHDNQVNITHAEEILYEQKIAPLSYTRAAPPGVGGAEGPGNYWVPIYKNSKDRVPSLVVWFFDSRGGAILHLPDVELCLNDSTGGVSPQGAQNEDFVDASVAAWMASEAKAMEEAWGPAGTTRSSLAFVHIPPHYIAAVQPTVTPEKNPGLNADVLGGPGSVQASVSPDFQGKDGPFWDAVKQNLPNLFAVISGHNHGNEWCAHEPTKGITFCYDKHSGYGGYGEPTWGFGVRNIIFHSSPDGGLPKAESWIRLEEGETRAHVWLNSTLGV
ncbi:hypothetical protein NP233_g5090 [Leucocoprinus birnbaumii]|uniref:Calcineurin-like phosphoesterase domain-containing protein n=1 Tax=Leucocoprinus birnbaumii TaxID=56174 RepID=A0AAD5YUX3_9AGAR|nr:hypothetical protein NP233_g5090 [Leucocoprinus birnbaumii]